LVILSLVSAGAFGQAEQRAEAPALKFSALPLTQAAGGGAVKVHPYRAEDTVMVQVEDAIKCGQRPVKPSFEIKGARLLLRYDLEVDNPTIGDQNCAAHSSFLLSAMPDRDLEVAFAHRGGPETTARMARCLHSKAFHDVWDCMVPEASAGTTISVAAPATVAGDHVAKSPSAADLKFTSDGSERRAGPGQYRISPYRAEDTIVVLVEEPIICGQTGTRPAFRLGDRTLDLQYSLSDAPAGATEACTLKSVFQVSEMPHRDLDVTFGNRTGTFLVGQMTRCGSAKVTRDPWDCLLPRTDKTPSGAPRAAAAAAPSPAMKFIALPINEAGGGLVQRLRPFRNGSTITAIAEAPIVCGQRPYMPSFEIVGNRLNLSFDLSPAPAGGARECVAHASFQISNVPERLLDVSFSSGPGPLVVATMERCPHANAGATAWDCMVPGGQ
jgi:hypothetical protein